MSQSSSFSVGVSIFGLLNFFLFVLHWWGQRQVPKNSSNCILSAATEVLQNNGKIDMKDALKKSCGKLKYDKEFPNALRRAMEETIEQCNKNSNRKIFPQTDTTLLTLFTSTPKDENELRFYENTIINWSSFIPKVNLVLFSNNSDEKALASDRGWTVYPVVHHPEGRAPVLRAMFKTVMSKINSTFYGYANNNLLFAGALVESLSIISSKVGDLDAMLLTGKRLQVENITQRDVTSLTNIHLAAKLRGQLVEHGENYLITTKTFPWDTIPELVTEGPEYSRFLVSSAVCKNVTVIDTSSTIVAVEQKMNLNDTGHKKPKNASYNYNVIKNSKLPRLHGDEHGDEISKCADWASYETFCGGVDISLRDKILVGCTCRSQNDRRFRG